LKVTESYDSKYLYHKKPASATQFLDPVRSENTIAR
jgi:hypothetical protein